MGVQEGVRKDVQEIISDELAYPPEIRQPDLDADPRRRFPLYFRNDALG